MNANRLVVPGSQFAKVHVWSLRCRRLAAIFLIVGKAHSQQLPGLNVSASPGGKVRVTWQDNGDPTLKLDYSGDAGLRARWAPVVDNPVFSGGLFSAEFPMGNKSGFWRLRKPDLVAPAFPPPTASPAVALGNVTRFRLQASDPSGPVSYTVEPNPLPDGAHIDETGVFTFRPVEGMAGDYTFKFIAADRWGNTTTRPVTVTVTVAPPGTPTSLTGLVVDLDATVGGGFVPVVNARVGLLGTAFAANTDAQGRFTISGIPGGLQVLDITTANALPGPGGAKYAFFRENYRLIPGVANVEDRPFFLPRLDESSMTPIVPGQSAGVVNPSLNIAMTVGANTAVTDNGSAFTGELSITRVPEELAPAKLPDELGRTSLVTIQPVGVQFTTPAPISFPNTDGLDPGSGTDLWSLDPRSGSWVIVGTGRVTPDGQRIETVSGGIRAAEWHSVMPPQPCPENGGDDPEHHDPNGNCNGASGSEVSVHTGGLRSSVRLPRWYSNGTHTGLEFVYNSRFAFPYSIVTYNAVNSMRAAVPESISQEVSVGGKSMGFPLISGGAPVRNGVMVVSSGYYYDTRRLREDRDESLRMAFGFDGSEMPTGYYPYRALVKSNYQSSSIGASFNRRTTVINESKSAFGAGWTISGLQKLHSIPDDPKRYLVVNGDGAHSIFTRGVTDRPFVVGGFSAQRSGAQSFPQGSTYSGARAAITEAFPQAVFAGMDTITAAGLGSADIIVLSPITGPTTATELTSAERSALFAWVQSGGCALLCVDHDLGRAAFHAANEALLAPFGITSENSSGDIVFVSPENSPITSGVFGDVARYTRAFGGRKVISPGNWGRSLAIDPEGGIGMVEVPENRIQPGSGQVLVVTDTQMFQNGGTGVDNANHRALLLNTLDSFLTTQEPPGADIVFRGPKGDFSRLLLKADGSFARVYPEGVTATFNPAGRHLSTVDANGGGVSFAYDASGRLASVTDTSGRAALFQYNGAQLRTVIDPAGRVTTFSHDSNGNLTGMTLPGGGVYVFDYDERHLMVRETAPAGFRVDREYDGCGRLVRTLWPDGSTREVKPVLVSALPNPNGSTGSETAPAPVVRVEDVQGSFGMPEGSAKIKTNNFGQELEVLMPDGSRRTFERNANGQPTRYTNTAGEQFTYAYDRLGREVEQVDVTFNGRRRHAYLPNLLRETAYTNEFNQVWSSQFDARGNRTLITSPGGLVTSATYDAAGRLASLSPPHLPAGITFARDAAGNLESVSFGSGAEARVTQFTNDDAGQPVSRTDALNGRTQFEWSPDGHLTKLTRPSGRAGSYSSDALSRLLSVTPPGRSAHLLMRDSQGRLIRYQPPGGALPVNYVHSPPGPVSLSAGSLSVGFSYHSSGRVAGAHLARGSHVLTFSGANPSQASSADGIVQNLQWRGSVPVRVDYSGAVAGGLQITHDAARRITAMKLNDRAPVAYSWTNNGVPGSAGALAFTRHATTGVITAAVLGGLTETYNYNPFGEETERIVTSGGSPVAAFVRGYDKLGRLVTEQETISGSTVTFAYTYDADSRLTAATRNGAAWYSCLWDANNNRTSVSGPGGTLASAYDQADQLLTHGGDTFTHDDLGQLASQSGTVNRFWRHDALGQLTGVTLADGTVVSYLYDVSGHPCVRLINGVRTRAFLWNTLQRLHAELDADNKVVAEFIHGRHPSVPEYMLRGGETYRFITDLRGSVRLVVNTASGAVAQRMDYDPWGRVIADSNPGFQPFGFGGGLYDHLTGLVTFGMRTYAPEFARWTSRDPIGFFGGDTNLYAYAACDPVNRIDPTGLVPPPQKPGGWTFFLGPTFTLGGGGSFSFSGGIVIDSTGNIGLTGSYGIGPMAGAGGSVTATGQLTGGDIYTLSGFGVNTGASGGELLVGGFDVVSTGEGLNATPIGGSISGGLGVGTPVEAHAISTQSGVVGFNVPSALSTAWNSYFGH